jgi:hypothetical protein
MDKSMQKEIMKAKVHSVVVDGILQLHLAVPPEALEAALALQDQAPVVVQHMTLVRLDDLGASVPLVELPAPPSHVALVPQTYLVDTGVKRACYLVATDEMQTALREYTLRCAEALGLKDTAVDPSRVYHVTVSNSGAGQVRASVGAPWEYPAHCL